MRSIFTTIAIVLMAIFAAPANAGYIVTIQPPPAGCVVEEVRIAHWDWASGSYQLTWTFGMAPSALPVTLFNRPGAPVVVSQPDELRLDVLLVLNGKRVGTSRLLTDEEDATSQLVEHGRTPGGMYNMLPVASPVFAGVERAGVITVRFDELCARAAARAR